MADLGRRVQGSLPKRYTLERELGRGGMSTVFLAREHHPSRLVAIKVLDPEVTVRLGRERFLREIDFVSNLTHPHLVPIFAAGEADGLLYFVMPYVSGETLAARVARAGALPVGVALRFAADVAQALEYAHRRNIMHRDIKPENILLHDDFALVADFGVARALRAAGSDTLTLPGFILGTPAYMSPEQASGSEEIDARSDIYSLGCVLYEMLAGSPPFGKGPTDRVLARHLAEPPAALRTKRPDLPKEIDDVLQTALAKSPTLRFATASEFAEALDQLRSTTTSGSRRAPLARRQNARGWAMVAALGLVVLSAALWWSVRQPTVPMLPLRLSYADSLAVMPIENLTGVPSFERLADALTYGVITSLHEVPQLKVSSYLSVRRLAQQRLGPRQIVDSLRVRAVLAGQFRGAGRALRLDVELVDGLTDQVLRSASWPVDANLPEGEEEALVRRLVDAVASGLALEESPERMASLHGPGHETYLLGKHWLGRRTPEGIRRALDQFRIAIALDSTYAPAYEGLSSAYMLALWYRYEIGLDGYEVTARALAAADRAIVLDPMYANGYAARGYAISRAYGPIREAARDFARALQLSPNTSEAVMWSSAVLAQQGRPDEALAATLRGVELDPFQAAAHLSLAYAAFHSGELDLAVGEARRATELEPEMVESRAMEGRALLLSEGAEDCLPIAFGPHAALRAACLHTAGYPDAAAALADSVARAVTNGQPRDSSYSDVLRADGLATYYAWVGDVASAMQWIEVAFDRSPLGIERRVLQSPLFDRVRADPEAKRQVDRITRGAWERVLHQPAVIR